MAPDSLNTPNKETGGGEIAVNGRRYRLPRLPTTAAIVRLRATGALCCATTPMFAANEKTSRQKSARASSDVGFMAP